LNCAGKLQKDRKLKIGLNCAGKLQKDRILIPQQSIQWHFDPPLDI
jgi:hypothetical protein